MDNKASNTLNLHLEKLLELLQRLQNLQLIPHLQPKGRVLTYRKVLAGLAIFMVVCQLFHTAFDSITAVQPHTEWAAQQNNFAQEQHKTNRSKVVEMTTEFLLEDSPRSDFVLEDLEIDLTDRKGREMFETCFAYNSETWIDGPRYGNEVDPLLDDTTVRHSITNLNNTIQNAHAVLNQTLAYSQSRFLTHLEDVPASDDKETIRLWAIRLIFLAVHTHQHKPALPEALHRLEEASKEMKCADEFASRAIGKFDFECPDANYLIAHNTNNGLGANRGHTLVSTLMAGLATDRVVLFTNGAPGQTGSGEKAWPLASCPRGDYQCFFAPPSPCVPTKQQLENGVTLTQAEKTQLFSEGVISEEHSNHKVLYTSSKHRIPKKFQLGGKLEPAIRDIALNLIDQLPTDDKRRPALQQAANLILEKDGPREGFKLEGFSKIFHALSFYALRPNLSYARRIEQAVQDALPDDFDPERSIGLPIRASDKCLKESECLNFLQHMYVTKKAWKKYQPTFDGVNLTSIHDASIIFTSESEDMLRQMHEFATKDGDSNYHFITNNHDVMPGSGRGITRAAKNVTADDAMLSAMSSLKLQLASSVTVGNCCSAFHVLVHDFLVEGLGAAKENTYQCLQEDDEPEYRPCCWKGRRCQKAKQKAIEAYLTAENATTSSRRRK